MSKSALLSILTVVGGFVLIIGVALAVVRPWEGTQAGGAAAQPGQTLAGGTALDTSTHLLTDAGEGAVEVVEFFDYECPACGAFHPIVEDLTARYGDRVTFGVRYFPLESHRNAVPAAAAAEAAAAQGQFEAMHNRILGTQEDWAGTDAAPVFRGYAQELGLDMAAYDAAVVSTETADRIAYDFDAGVGYGVNSTPTFYVDGVRVELSELGDLEAAVQQALEG